MPNTTNFNWVTPADTDLVKDGAAAIRTLGNNIDASLVDLKGGTTGQVLSKASNTDLDFTWVAQDDSNAIQNAIVDAKGDLITATAADTPARLASSGVNGEVLTVDTTTATGLKWAALPSTSPTFVGCFLWKGAQTIPTATATAITWGTEVLDTDGFHSTTSNTDRITIPTGKGGKYLVLGQTQYQAGNNDGVKSIANNIYKNGSFYSVTYSGPQVNHASCQTMEIMSLNAGDYISLYAYQDRGSDLTMYGDDNGACSFGVIYLGA